ncbi:MAG: hypothetical protein UX20_C0005G0006 [Candidatus Magasanikbacteria bacterium GW2011_GWC2_45_8]|uniref:DUF11 domain-containing protein n=1 Tax=Candidatus Magasanikbacteria bacterium GW2011_GWC2_45_8 TaxID=1619050 RepID=A0A0G1Q8X7_9BACT|nr:MAG: hypothetical protein UX20_C0005G0006 [Candidatus Magasanikbacteria bacterium GW2011_GWC2_45_8]
MSHEQNNQLPEEKSLEGEIISKETTTQAAQKGVFINTLNIITAPAQSILKPLKHHYHHRYHKRFPRHHKKIFFFDLALITVIILLGAFASYYLLLKPTFRPLDISIASTDQKIIIGTEHAWELRISNTTKKTLRNITTTLTFPSSFKIVASTGENSSSSEAHAPATRVWKLDPLSGKENLSLDVRGILFSPVGETVKIIARTEGITDSKEPFSETDVLELRATNPALLTTVDFPKSILAGESFPFSVSYTNASGAMLEHSIIRFEVPSSFVLNNKPSSWQNGSIALPTLAPGAHGSIELNGSLTADSRANRLSIGIQTSAELNGRRVTQEDLLPSLSVTPTGINVSLKNVESNGTPGKPLRLLVSLDHMGSETFQTVSVCVPMENQNIELHSIKGDGKLEDNQYCFTPATQTKLKEIKNGFHGEWPITFSLKPVFNQQNTQTNKNAVLAFTPKISLIAPHTPPVKLSLNGPELRVPITTTLTLQTMGRYFTNEGDQLGRGPLPPQAGKTTKYWIAWAINSSLNPIKNLVVRATLPSSIQWTGKSTVTKGKSITYDPATREVRWTNELLEPTAETCACAEGGFEISLTPSEGDIGTATLLIKNLSADGIDAWTEVPLHALSPDITSELPDDPMAEGKGRVQK